MDVTARLKQLQEEWQKTLAQARAHSERAQELAAKANVLEGRLLELAELAKEQGVPTPPLQPSPNNGSVPLGLVMGETDA